MSHWDFGRPPADHHNETLDDAALDDGALDDGALDDAEAWAYPITYERGRIDPDALRPAPDEPFAPDWLAPDQLAGDQLADESWLRAPTSTATPTAWPPQPQPQPPLLPWHDGSPPGGEASRRRHRRWLPVACVAAIGASTVLLISGRLGSAPPAPIATRPAAAPAPTPAAPTPAAPTPAAPAASRATVTAAPPLSMAQAQAVLAGYTTANNRANALRSDQRLAAIETGSSYAIDAALYRTQRAAGAAPYPAYETAGATYYLPRAEPATGPRWFVAEVANAFASSPKKVSSVEYLLFLQAAPGAPWRNAIEPYLLPGASAPRIAVGDDGLATAIATTATSLSVAPVQLPGLTASSFDGSGPMAIPAGVADRTDERSWQEQEPTLTITDRHAPATAGQAFALLTADGGALVFYTVAATMTITGPAGTAIHLNIPGLYSPAQSLRRAVLQFRDQFAAYDPPAGSGTPRVIADYSGITRKM